MLYECDGQCQTSSSLLTVAFKFRTRSRNHLMRNASDVTSYQLDTKGSSREETLTWTSHLVQKRIGWIRRASPLLFVRIYDAIRRKGDVHFNDGAYKPNVSEAKRLEERSITASIVQLERNFTFKVSKCMSPSLNVFLTLFLYTAKEKWKVILRPTKRIERTPPHPTPPIKFTFEWNVFGLFGF